MPPIAADRGNPSSITTREIEGGLDQFLYSYVGSGEAESKGAILIKSVPSSKLRKSAAQAFSARTPIPITSWQVKDRLNDGVFVMESTQRDETIHWLPKLEEAAQRQGLVSVEMIESIMRGNGKFGEQCMELRSTPQGLRQALQISAFPVCAPDGRFRELCQEAAVPSLYGSYINISGPGAIVPMRTSIVATTTVYFHHRGAQRTWIVVPPKEKASLEKRMSELLNLDDGCCSQFIRHARVWVTKETLRKWKIEFFEIVQEERQLMFFFPGSYFLGHSDGFSVVESKLHAGQRWSVRGYQYCDLETGICRLDNIGVSFEKMSLEVPASGKYGQSTPRRGGRKRKDTSDMDGVRSIKRNRAYPVVGEKDKVVEVESMVAENVIEEQSDAEGTIQVEQRGARKEVQIGSQVESFDISDDEVVNSGILGSNDSRVLQLQHENTALLRDLAEVRSERDKLQQRKGMYKARLREREGVIASLEQELQDLKRKIEVDTEGARRAAWEDMKMIVESKINGE